MIISKNQILILILFILSAVKQTHVDRCLAREGVGYLRGSKPRLRPFPKTGTTVLIMVPVN
jgi:hypothetical protein